MLCQCPQATFTHSTGLWTHPALPSHSFQQHDHVNPNNRHKRRKIQTERFHDSQILQGTNGWSDDQFNGVFSPEEFDMALNHALPDSNTISSFDFDSQCANHQHFKHYKNEWTGDTANSIVSLTFSLIILRPQENLT
jgi:hypothetical protein